MFLALTDELLVFVCTAHTPDNSFLGFVVPKAKMIAVTKKENYALIIGKEPRYLKVCSTCRSLTAAAKHSPDAIA